MKKLVIHCDGASRGNPGPAASGFVVYKNSLEIFKAGYSIGVETNNVAEYKAVIFALEWLIKFSQEFESVEIVLDSQLVARQLIGEYKIKNVKLISLAKKIKKLENYLKHRINYSSVLRSKNKIADGLVNQVLDQNKNCSSNNITHENETSNLS